MRLISKPQVNADEFAPYASMYIDLLPDDGLILQHLQTNLQAAKDLVSHLSDDALSTPHEAGEWTIKEIFVHMMDDERIYAYRALRFARGDDTELPGFEQDDYVAPSKANQRTLVDIFDEYAAVRQATITLFASFDDAALTRTGVASGHQYSVRGLLYHLAGHELHHLNSIKENYLSD